MVLADFLTETRRKWLQAFKLFKRTKCRKGGRNRVSPELVQSPCYSGTVADINLRLRRVCGCHASVPPLHIFTCSTDKSPYSTCNSYDSSARDSIDGCISDATRTDSAYESARSSPACPTLPTSVCYATVTYFNVNDSEDSSSIHTEYTLLDADGLMEVETEDEHTQNIINESIELVGTL